MKSILHDLELPTMEQIIHVRILRLFEKVAHMPGGRLTREVLRSHARPVGAIKRGPKEMSTRKSYVRTLRAAGLLDKTSKDSAGAYAKWMHRFGEHDSGRHIDEQLGLEGTDEGRPTCFSIVLICQVSAFTPLSWCRSQASRTVTGIEIFPEYGGPLETDG